MVRVIIKGGVWKNTEDEILKAAIMKYGKNQWSRIASLLHRKSAKQCKARWYEWLDPRIKKTEWSREEDEKLLHLAKIMPTQWRTIAPIVGRTAAQCLERYEHLLDEAQRRAEGIEDADTIKEAKKLKPGDVDPTPETKPARPDPIDMDEDELEMLSEARARLANTQGKKAKRKAREKQLGEARRLASLQKRRELRAAGIMIGSGGFTYKMRKRGLIDYNAEVPFEKEVPLGFHDPTEDKFDKNQKTMSEERRRDRQELEDRKKDKEKLKRKRAEDNPESIFSEKHEKKRSKLLLPDPQISDAELDDIIKIGHVSDTVRELVDDNPTSTLLHDYNESSRLNAVSSRTQRTPAGAIDTVKQAADDLLALTNVETPLKGGLNTPLHTLDFSGQSSTKQVVATPNTVLTAVAATPKSVITGEQTPGAPSTPGQTTPFRDQLNINQLEIIEPVPKIDLQRKFQSLPTPKNDFELILPEEESDESLHTVDEQIEDAKDIDERRAKLIAKQKELQLLKRTSVIQRHLPLPTKLNSEYKVRSNVDTELSKADDQIKAEMYALMEWDVDGKEPARVNTKNELKDAQNLIDAEAAALAKADEVNLELDDDMWRVIKTCSNELIRHKGQRFTRLQNLNKRDQLEALEDQYKILHNWWTAQHGEKIRKIEKRVKVKMAGYTAIQTNLESKIEELRKDKSRLLIELRTFQRLEENEQKAIVKRTNTIVEELRQQEHREKELQKHYDALKHRIWELNEAEKRQNATTAAQPVPYSTTTSFWGSNA